MSRRPQPLEPVPEDTARVARAAFPKGNPYLTWRDQLGPIFQDEDFAALFPACGQPGLSPWRLALVTIMPFRETLADRQATEAVRARIDWKYLLGLELTDPGFDVSVLSEFRDRLLAGHAEELLLEKLLERCGARGLLKARGPQRTDATHVLAAIRVLNRLELVAETLRAALNGLATVTPDWLQAIAPAAWYARYGRRIEDARLPTTEAKRQAYAQTVGEDGFPLLDALDASEVPQAARALPVIADPAPDLAAPLRTHARRGRGGWHTTPPPRALADEPPVAPCRRGHRIALRCRRPLPPHTGHAVDGVHGPSQRDV